MRPGPAVRNVDLEDLARDDDRPLHQQLADALRRGSPVVEGMTFR